LKFRTKIINKFKYVLLDTPKALNLEIYATLPNPSNRIIQKIYKSSKGKTSYQKLVIRKR